MNTNSFTDEQLLNLINETILDETEYTLDMFTGGSTQVTTTHNNRLTNYKVLLYFGYNEKRNPITYTEEIQKDEYFIWNKAIMLKVESLKLDNTGKSFDKLNARMNKKDKNRKEVVGKEVVGKEVVGIGRGDTTSLRTSYEDTKFSFSLAMLTQVDNLSKQYLLELKSHIEESKRNLSYEEFINGLEAKGSKYKNFKSAYTTWANNKDKWDKASNKDTTYKSNQGFVANNKTVSGLQSSGGFALTPEQAKNIHNQSSGYMINGGNK